MSMQALKESLPAGELGGMGGIQVTVTAGSLPQQQPRGPYNMQVFNHGNTQVLMAQGLSSCRHSINAMAVSKRLDCNECMDAECCRHHVIC